MKGWALGIGVLCVASVAQAAPDHSGETESITLRTDASLNTPSPFLLAQSDEPAAPAKKGEPAPPAKTEPAPPASGEPSKGGDEPGKGEPSKGEPSKGEPATGDPQGPAQILRAKTKAGTTYGVGFHVRAIMIHKWFLGLFLKESTPLNSVGFGGEFVRRKGNFDLVASVDFGFYSPRDGNYLGKGKNAATETDYVDFRGLNILAFAVHFIWHHEFTPWLSLVYGAGVGVGVVLGGLYRVSNDSSRCTPENAGNINQCFPRGMDPSKREEWLATHPGTGGDSPENPALFKEDDVWPVIPVVHLLVGLNFKISDQFSVRVDGGFRDAFYVGATGHYFF